MIFRLSTIALLGAVITAPAVHAQQKPHEHGHWKLNTAIEDGHLQVELIAPGADVVGFEHEARTASDKAAVWKAREKLKAAESILILPSAAGCALEEAHADVDGMEADHDPTKHHSHEHDHKDNRDDRADSNSQEEGTHNEFHTSYVFACEDTAELQTIGVNIFKIFPSTEEIEAAVLTPNGQRAAKLDKNNTIIDLSDLL